MKLVFSGFKIKSHKVHIEKSVVNTTSNEFRSKTVKQVWISLTFANFHWFFISWYSKVVTSLTALLFTKNQLVYKEINLEIFFHWTSFAVHPSFIPLSIFLLALHHSSNRCLQLCHLKYLNSISWYSFTSSKICLSKAVASWKQQFNIR